MDVLEPHASTIALGAPSGGRECVNAMALDSVKATSDLRSAILEIDHPQTELVLTRQCADVSKLMYQMRLNGDRFTET
eukprot:5591648-Karenia_brevis.AAC.1